MKSRGLGWTERACLAAVPLAALAAYWGSWRGSFHYDDFPYIVRNPAIAGPFSLRLLWSSWPTRLLPNLTLALDRILFGPGPGPHLAVNLAMHAVNGMLLFLLIRAIPRPDAERGGAGLAAALFGALLFVLHPLQTEAVLYAFQRGTLLAATVYLGGLACCARWLAAGGAGGDAWYAGAFACGALGLAAKENAVTFAPAAALYAVCLHGRPDRRTALRLLALASLVPAAAALQVLAKPETFRDLARLADSPASGAAYALTQLKVHLLYLRLLAWPAGLTVDHDAGLESSLASPLPLAGLAALAALAALALRLRRAEPRASFAVLLYMLAMSVESGVIPLRDLAYEHRLYLPMAAVALAAAAAAESLMRRLGPARAAAVALAALAACGAAARARGAVWRDEISLWSDAVSKSPLKDRPYFNRGTAYGAAGRYEEAVRDFDAGLEINLSRGGARDMRALLYRNRALAQLRAGRPDKAEADWRLAVESAGDFPLEPLPPR